MLQNINEWLEKEDKASMLLFINPILLMGFIYKKEYLLSIIVFLFIILQTRRCICYVRKKMQEEDSRE